MNMTEDIRSSIIDRYVAKYVPSHHACALRSIGIKTQMMNAECGRDSTKHQLSHECASPDYAEADSGFSFEVLFCSESHSRLSRKPNMQSFCFGG